MAEAGLIVRSGGIAKEAFFFFFLPSQNLLSELEKQGSQTALE